MKTNKNIILPVTILLAGDLFFILLGYYLSFYLRYYGHIPARNLTAFENLLPYICVATIAIFYCLGLYERRFSPLSFIFKTTILAILSLGFISTAFAFWSRDFAFPRSVILLSFFMQVILLLVWRTSVYLLEKKYGGKRSLLIISGIDSNGTKKYISDLPSGWFELVGHINQKEIAKLNRNIGRIDVILLMPELDRNYRNDISRICMEQGIELYIAPTINDLLFNKASMLTISDHPVMRVDMIGLSTIQMVVKRINDIVVSGLALTLTSPLILLISLLIKITSKGEIIYSQDRVGQNSKMFKIYKFRTMVSEAESETGPVMAKINDPRITTIGKILRITRLDELPQLVNVLKGEMSIVGPRPERPYFIDKYSKYITYYHLRHLFKPGITGLAQVMGKYTTTVEDKVRYDIYYIRNYSLLLDMKIIIQTLPVLLFGESSKGFEDKLYHCNKNINRKV